MDKDNFLTQVERLRHAYGEKAYPAVRVEVFWKSFGRYDVDVFADAVTKVIGEEQYPPMLTKLGEAVMEAQARYRASFRSQPTALTTTASRSPEQEAKSKELADFCKKFIDGLMFGKVNRDDAKSAQVMLTSWVGELRKQRGEPALCLRCEGSGYVDLIRPSGNREIARCDCALGRAHPEFIDYGKAGRVRWLTYSEAKQTMTARFP